MKHIHEKCLHEAPICANHDCMTTVYMKHIRRGQNNNYMVKHKHETHSQEAKEQIH